MHLSQYSQCLDLLGLIIQQSAQISLVFLVIFNSSINLNYPFCYFDKLGRYPGSLIQAKIKKHTVKKVKLKWTMITIVDNISFFNIFFFKLSENFSTWIDEHDYHQIYYNY